MNAGQADWSPDGSRHRVRDRLLPSRRRRHLHRERRRAVRSRPSSTAHGVTGTGNEQALQVDGYYDPVWSPDGTKIIAGREFLDDDGTFRLGLVMVDADGSDLHWTSPTAP